MKLKLLLGFSFLGWLVSLVIYILSYFDRPGLMEYSFLIHGGAMFTCMCLILRMSMTKRPLRTKTIWDFLRYIRALRQPYGIILSSGFAVLLANMCIGLFVESLSKHAPTGTHRAEIEAARFFPRLGCWRIGLPV